MEGSTIFSLPSEIILMILDYTSYMDVNRFGRTCRKFNDLLKDSHSLWKKKYKIMVHPEIMLAKDGSLNWFEEMKKYVILKRNLIYFISEMPAKYYLSFSSRISGVSKEHLKDLLTLVLADKSSLGESIYILQEFIRKGNIYLNNNFLVKPYSLTTLYYAKTVLQSLMHMYLSFYWELHNMNQPMCPLEVVNFFVQWVDPVNVHSLKEVYKHMKELKTVIKWDLMKNNQSKVKDDVLQAELLTEDDIIKSISNVIYKQRYITLMPHTNLDTLDTARELDILTLFQMSCLRDCVVKKYRNVELLEIKTINMVLRNRVGSMITMGAIYQNIGYTLGLQCSLIAFPNHFILELERRDCEKDVVHKISLDTGECRPKGRCPFTQTYFPVKRNVYCPTSLAKYIATEFLSSMGELRDWYTVNVECLLDMLNVDHGSCPNIDLIRYMQNHSLGEPAAAASCCYEPNYFNMHPNQLSILQSFLRTDNVQEIKRRNVIPKTRDSSVKYAIGMICYHKQYNYVCLIYQWHSSCYDTSFSPTEIRTLQFGIRQPFYHVIALDQSKRYVPQENLVVFDRPTRLYHLEDIIARDFSHFNGFAYVPNEEKAKEYPEDIAVSELFKCHYEMQNYGN